jgi:hypothetical protein
VALNGLDDGGASAAVVAGQGVSENLDQFLKTQLVVVAASAVSVEEGVEDGVAGKKGPQIVESVGQRETGQGFQRVRRSHAVLGTILGGWHNHRSSTIS